jgi:TRAP-type C4-dicarboxylate transport system permease large subunit
MWWFVAGIVVGVITTIMCMALASILKKTEYEDKLWELERLKEKLLYESRERENSRSNGERIV